MTDHSVRAHPITTLFQYLLASRIFPTKNSQAPKKLWKATRISFTCVDPNLWSHHSVVSQEYPRDTGSLSIVGDCMPSKQNLGVFGIERYCWVFETATSAKPVRSTTRKVSRYHSCFLQLGFSISWCHFGPGCSRRELLWVRALV